MYLWVNDKTSTKVPCHAFYVTYVLYMNANEIDENFDLNFETKKEMIEKNILIQWILSVGWYGDHHGIKMVSVQFFTNISSE